MKLKSCLKKYKDDTHRALPPEDTLSRIDAKMPAAGITRVADITNLDRIGIPVFSSIRPMAKAVPSPSTMARVPRQRRPKYQQ